MSLAFCHSGLHHVPATSIVHRPRRNSCTRCEQIVAERIKKMRLATIRTIAMRASGARV